jgi:hypothetical protein
VPLSVKKDELGRITAYTVDNVPHTVDYNNGTMTWTDGTSVGSLSLRDLGEYVPTVPELFASPGGLDFISFKGTNAASQTFKIEASDGKSYPISLSESASWLTLTPTSGVTPLTVTAAVDQSSLPASATPYHADVVWTAGTDNHLFGIDYQVRELPTLPSDFYLLVASSPTRSSPVNLSGVTITGNQYIYVANDSAIQSVAFYLDDPTPSAPTGVPVRVENHAPWDFGGTDVSTGQAIAYNLSPLAAGSHTVSAVVTRTAAAGGGSAVITATFTKGGSAPSVVTTRTFNPGAYFRVGTNAANTAGTVNLTIGAPAFKGVQLVQFWGNLETADGVFNDTTIVNALAACESKGKQLLLQIPHVWFNAQNVTPAYIRAGSQYAGGESIRTAGTYKRWIKVWNPYVRAKYIRWLEHLGALLDNEPNFEGIVFDEIFGPDGSLSNFTDFTVAGYVDAMKEIMTRTQAAFPHKNIFWYYNWQKYLDSRTANAAYPSGKFDTQIFLEHSDATAGGMGMPDTVPGDATFGRPLMQARQLARPLMCSMQGTTQSRISNGTTTYDATIAYAMMGGAGYKSHYQVWESWPNGSYNAAAVKAAYAAAGNPINSVVPTGIG